MGVRVVGSSGSEDSDGPEDESLDIPAQPIRPEKVVEGSAKAAAPSIDRDVTDESQSEDEDSIPHFMPSLAVGYISGSDSEATDIEDDVAPRKNRRGQRARQTIWEKKFGGGAKHLKQQETRDTGWDSKHGATGKDDGPYWKRKLQKKSDLAFVEGANAAPVNKPRVLGQGPQAKAESDAPVHPSWIAKQKAKEKEAVQFQGKKITFD